MTYKWKPSISQKKAFAERMKDPAEQAAYEERKKVKAEKRRAGSQFDYSSAGGMYIPTKQQHDFAVFEKPSGLTQEQEQACNMVAYGFSCQEKINHDFIHIVNDLRRKACTLDFKQNH